MSPLTIALVGDYSSEVPAHRAIPRALELARAELGAGVDWQWVPTRAIHDAPRQLGAFAAVWVVPASPYENMAGALAAIRFARETGRPFLGTCGGFQHALIEFARNVAGFASADHAETNPGGDTLIVTPLACSLVEKAGELRFAPGSRLREIYGRDTAQEGYHCNYGVNPAHRAALEAAGMRFSAFAADGDIRAAELPASGPGIPPAIAAPRARARRPCHDNLPAPDHPFFIGTLFQPERAALRGEVPPLVRAFVHATTMSPIK